MTSCLGLGRVFIAYGCLLVISAICNHASSASSGITPIAPRIPRSINCYSCIYYANVYVRISNKACVPGEAIDPVPCPPGFACKVTFLQDSMGAIVHASRSCEHSGSFRSTNAEVSVVLNARTTLYCRQHGCNNNWDGAPFTWTPKNDTRLHCWVGYGRRFDYDKFKLQPCSQEILRLSGYKSSSGSSSSTQQQQTPVCLLAQLTRQIEYKGQKFESAAYVADCAPHASSVYGQNYPMFEYERACMTPECNSGGAANRIDIGLLTLATNHASVTGHAVVVSFLLAASATRLRL